jgi:hypothetical protein
MRAGRRDANAARAREAVVARLAPALDDATLARLAFDGEALDEDAVARLTHTAAVVTAAD